MSTVETLFLAWIESLNDSERAAIDQWIDTGDSVLALHVIKSHLDQLLQITTA